MERLTETRGYVIRVGEMALIQLLQSGLEAYSVTHQRKGPKNRLETYGLLWGHETKLVDGRMIYAVEMATVDTSARMGHSTILASEKALDLKRDLMTSYWPHLEFLGDFHTHPYSTVQQVRENQGHQFSEADIEDVENRPDYWRSHHYRVGLVLTVSLMGRASSRRNKEIELSTIEFTAGNYRMWLKGYVLAEQGGHLVFSDHNDDRVSVVCDALMALKEITPFGRGLNQGHRPGVLEMNRA